MRVQLLMAQSAERELGMAWLWPERLDIEVPAAVTRVHCRYDGCARPGTD